MKSKNTYKNTEDDHNLKNALLKILIDLNIELPDNINTLKIAINEEEENIELKDIINEE